ncbi:MAG: helix-turn-helix domain-containing protein [Casimicrobiaceae bacterium]
MNRRTLARRLKASGQSFRDVRDQLSFEVARSLLGDSAAPIADIAGRLGYSETAAFTRAFRRWSGKSPTIWRSQRHIP